MKRYLFALLLVGCAGATEPPAADAKNPVVVMKTSAGTIKIELFEDKAPISVKNFLTYVDDKHYDGTIFHRVISTFMVQGGGFKKGLNKVTDPEDLEKYEKKTKAAIKNESSNGLENKRGTLAMARTSRADSATAQFFINVKDNDFLDKANANDGVGYAVFGKVIEGMDVVDKIKGVKTKTLFRGFGDVPVEDVVIESVKREDK
jgi:peptidyl-prolyl cis-trans isomerase B (cyclophilin B)